METILKSPYEVLTIQEICELTIKGKIEIDGKHPFKDKKDILTELKRFFSQIEEYEKCAELNVLIKESNSGNSLYDDLYFN